MKTLKLLIPIVGLLLLSACTDVQEEQPKPIPKLAPPKLVIVFGTKSHPCGGTDCYCVGDKGICLIIRIEKFVSEDQLGDGKGTAEMQVYDDGEHMRFSVLSDYDPDYSDKFDVEDHIELDDGVAAALGYTSVTIKKGTYDVSYSDYTDGEVILDVETTK